MSNKFQISYFFVPGAQSRPDSDIFTDDLTFGVPYIFVQKAIADTKKNKNKKYIFVDNNKWHYEETLPVLIDEKYAVEFDSGELKSHEYMISMWD